jgi:HSP20 family protein
MTVVKFDPFRSLETVSKRMNEFFADMEKGVRFEIGDFSPRVDISENADQIFIHAEIPGVAKEDIKISMTDDNVLSIRGEKKRVEKTEDRNFVRVERNYGSFTRSFMLPDTVNFEGIAASFNNGVLEITLPKKEQVKPREISIDIQ